MSTQVFSLNQVRPEGKKLVIDGDQVWTGGELVEKEMGL